MSTEQISRHKAYSFLDFSGVEVAKKNQREFRDKEKLVTEKILFLGSKI